DHQGPMGLRGRRQGGAGGGRGHGRRRGRGDGGELLQRQLTPGSERVSPRGCGSVAGMPIVHRRDSARLTVLPPHLLRVEWSPSGRFEDRATQVVLERDLGPVEVRVTPVGEGVEVVTEGFEAVYTGGPFTASSLSLQVRGGVTNYHSVWRYGEPP